MAENQVAGQRKSYGDWVVCQQDFNLQNSYVVYDISAKGQNSYVVYAINAKGFVRDKSATFFCTKITEIWCCSYVRF